MMSGVRVTRAALILALILLAFYAAPDLIAWWQGMPPVMLGR